jgi:hypothetical protein
MTSDGATCRAAIRRDSSEAESSSRSIRHPLSINILGDRLCPKGAKP